MRRVQAWLANRIYWPATEHARHLVQCRQSLIATFEDTCSRARKDHEPEIASWIREPVTVAVMFSSIFSAEKLRASPSVIKEA